MKNRISQNIAMGTEKAPGIVINKNYRKKTIKHENLFQRQYYRKALAMEQIFEYLPINDNFSMSTVPVERKRQEMSLVMNR